ncbi:MAG: voltage-gated potassium channel [Planctomycetota bacterium]|nr:voltage-gated potassium channel [Planctomycetota bacterium]
MKRARRPRRAWWIRHWREVLLAALNSWNRNQVSRVVLAVIASWILGATAIHFAERRVNDDFDTWGGSLWNVWVLLFSGLDTPPKTVVGRLATMVILVLGVGLSSLFTASVASVLIARYMRRKDVSTFEMENHLVLCNWAPRGLDWIREVHAKIIHEPRPIVIIHDVPEEIDLPDKQDEAAFGDVYIVKGDPTSEIVLRRAKVPRAHSVVVLTDEREGKHADGKSVLTCIAIRNICRGEKQPSIAAECLNPSNRHHLKKAGADEIISSTELGLRLLARTALFHGMTRVYQELLTVGRDANEMYLLRAPEGLVGKDFIELADMFLHYRGDRRSCLLLGIQRGDDMMLNPIGSEVGPLQEDDQLILLSRVFLDASQPLPTTPSLGSAATRGGATP